MLQTEFPNFTEKVDEKWFQLPSFHVSFLSYGP